MNCLFIKIDRRFTQLRIQYDLIYDIIHVIFFVLILKFLIIVQEIALYLFWLYELHLYSFMVALKYSSPVAFHEGYSDITSYRSPVEFYPDYETLANILLQYDVVKWSFDFIYSITENMIIYSNNVY